MIKAILFDLDGTLLPLDTDDFLRQYLKAIGQSVAHLTDPNKFVQDLMASTYVMIENTNPHLTNEEVFWNDFLARVGVPQEVLMPVLDDFYAHKFPELVLYANPTPLSREIVEAAAQRGFGLVIATNPVFPTAAVRERMRWIGIDDHPFDLVTTYEIMHYCKPQVAYYEEILEKTGYNAAECLMVGNDPYEDLVAAKLGMKTFLVEDYLVDRPETGLSPDYRGALADVFKLITQL